MRRPPFPEIRTLRRLTLLLPLALPAPACSPATPAPERPNVLLVVVDTLRPDRLGCYGGERESSPHLDGLADGFFLFESAQSCSPWTAPSLVSLMTGLHPDVHGVKSFPVPRRLARGVTTLAERLRASGYRTAAFTEGGYARGRFGLDRGFDLYPEESGDEQFTNSSLLGPSRLASNLDRTIRWLERREDEPFFCFFHTYETHMPFRAPEDHVREVRPEHDESEELERIRETIVAWNEKGEVDRAALRRLRTFYFQHRVTPGMPELLRPDALMARAEALGSPLDMDGAMTDPDELSEVHDLYDAEVRYTDEQLARLWKALEEEGHAENTIVILFSDHGEGLGDHGRLGHGEELHEELLRVLLMLRLPDGPEPRRIPDVVRSVDVFPTLLELLDLPPTDHDLDGESLVPLLHGETIERPAFAHALSSQGGRDPRRSIRLGRWRLITHGTPEGVELYDLETDPRAEENVAALHADVVAGLRAKLARQLRHDADLRGRLRAGETSPVAPDPELMRELKRLGYTGGLVPEED